MSKPLRWGVLGTANIALKKVIPAIQRARDCTVAAIASRDAARAAAVAADLKIPRSYGSYDELIADPSIDVIYNPLPNHLHVPLSIQAAEAGKHVLCEKPVALSAAEAEQLLRVRDFTGVQIAEAFMVRTHPQWQAVRERVQRGSIGELKLITGHFSYYKRDASDIRSKPEWGGGALMDVGCYLVTLSRWLFGAEPRRVLGLIDRDPSLGIDRLTSGLLDFAAGQALFSCGTQLVPFQRVQVLGTRGRIEIEIPFNAPPDRRCRIILDDGRTPWGDGISQVKFPRTDQFRVQAEAFARAVRGENDVAVPLEDSVANMRVIDAVFRSAERGGWEQP